MRKVICLIIIIVMMVVLSGSNYYVIPEEAIRFRIIPNSNSTLDILMKEKVQNEISDIVEEIESDSIDKSRVNILKNIENIERRIDNIFITNDYNMDYEVNYGINEFPEKIYKGVKYEAGDYESLIVKIGEGQGDNFWCVLYPPLCMMDETEEDEVSYKFKIVEMFKKYFD